MLGRESDSSVVPMKLGNSDGGKASYQLSSLLETHLLHSEVEMIMETKLVRIAELAISEPKRLAIFCKW